MRFYVSSKKKVTASRSSNPLDQASAGCRPGLRPPYLANSAVFRVVGHGRFKSCYQRAAGERRCTAAGVKQRVMSRIFISHSSSNNAEAVALRDWLRDHGWDDLFLDLDPERGLKAGERWQAALKQAAERCELVIFLVSPEWAASKWCLAEFLLAKNLNKRIFGVIVEPTPLRRPADRDDRRMAARRSHRGQAGLSSRPLRRRPATRPPLSPLPSMGSSVCASA